MSLEEFQRAFADLVASPRRCLELREDESVLDAYDLDPRERNRLVAMAGNEGMSHNCTLYRANRLTPIARSLPKTCLQLGKGLLKELEAFWASEPDSELQFKREAERFALFLIERIRSGAVEDATIEPLLRSELEELESRFGLDVHP